VSDPQAAIDLIGSRSQAGEWTRRLLWYLRIIAGLSMLKGFYHWSMIVGIGGGSGAAFEAGSVSWQASTMFFAVIDLVSAVGLWLAAAWGGVLWLTSAVSMAAVELFFPQIYGGRLLVAFAEIAAILGYVGLTLMAARERPP
jgi:hypothetical protein